MIFKLLLLLSLYIPFQIALNPTEGIDLASVRVFILLLFLLWLAEGLKNRKLVIKSSFITGFILTFIFFIAFSLFFASNFGWSSRKLIYLLSIFPIYFVSSAIIDSSGKMEKIIRYLVYSGVAAAVLGISQFFLQFLIGLERTYSLWASYVSVPFLGHTLSETVQNYPSWLVNLGGETFLRATSTFPDPHMFSFFLGLLLPFALGLFLKNRNLLYLIGFFLLFMADILTFSRGGYLGLFFGFLVFWFSGVIGLPSKYKLSISVIVAGLLVGLFFIPNPVSKRFSSSFDLKEGSNRGRLEMWDKAGEAIRDYPLTGVGLGNYPLFFKPTADYREPIYAHNTYLDIAAETGVFNALVWVGILVVSMYKFLRKSYEPSPVSPASPELQRGEQTKHPLPKGEEELRGNPLFLACFVGMVIFFVHSMVETAVYSPVVLALLLIIIGFGNIDDKRTQIV